MGDLVHGGGDLYLSAEGEDACSAEFFPNDAEHNPIVRELQPGVRYRFAQLLPTPKSYVIPDSYLFYIDDDGQVWDAVTHRKIFWSEEFEPNVVRLETEWGFNVVCSVRSTDEPDQELVGVPLEINFPSNIIKFRMIHTAQRTVFEEEPMT